MRIRVASGLLLLASAFGYLAVALPTRTRAAAAQDQFARAREERQRLHTRRAELERRQEAGERAAQVMAAAGATNAVTALRRAVVTVVADAPVTGVQLSVSRGRGPVAARFHLSASGRFPEIVRLSGRLARPGAGLVLERLRFAATEAGLRLEAEGLTLAAGP